MPRFALTSPPSYRHALPCERSAQLRQSARKYVFPEEFWASDAGSMPRARAGTNTSQAYFGLQPVRTDEFRTPDPHHAPSQTAEVGRMLTDRAKTRFRAFCVNIRETSGYATLLRLTEPRYISARRYPRYHVLLQIMLALFRSMLAVFYFGPNLRLRPTVHFEVSPGTPD